MSRVVCVGGVYSFIKARLNRSTSRVNKVPSAEFSEAVTAVFGNSKLFHLRVSQRQLWKILFSGLLARTVRGSAVGVESDRGLDGREVGAVFPVEATCSLLHTFQAASGAPGVRQPGHKTHISSPTNAEVKKRQSFSPSTLLGVVLN
jgi:hypothetical protein